MDKHSRTGNAMINALTGSAMQIVNVVLGFISRTIFIYLLNSDYLGVNSLYTNILTVLSFAELGIGSAIVFSLYKPIADKDKTKIQALMKLYKRAYCFIGISVLVMGLCVIPFLPYIIREKPDVKENLTLVYVLFLINTSASYFCSYKKTLITANQKDYIVQIYTRIFQFVQIVLQSVFLFFTHQYLTYLIIYIVCTLGQNIALSIKADKMYPFITEKNDAELSENETKQIFANVKALFVYKIGSVVLNGTDNIIISAIINVGTVGIASNYTMLMNNVTNVVGSAITSLTASVGNLSVKGSKTQMRDVMHQLLLLCVWLYGFIAIGFFVLANDFVELWIGKNYLLEQSVVFAILFSLYINGVQYAAYTFRTTQGLFVQSRWVPLISAIINIILSIWWGKLIGLTGIFIATGISRLCTTTIVDPWLVYKNNFGKAPVEYYIKYIMESLGVVINGLFQIWLINKISINGWLGFFVKGIAICITANLIFLIEFGWTKDFKALVRRVIPQMRKKKG
ncbi:oligosaccharide flippase family protein [Blautia luti]|uniref:Polysaccharide biosynthesis protein n=1 Tax=Blautia luti DSM 14534 = JCM 17040 TaxID=649762 RepID=A0A844GJ46_9FIRM|nr:hypothetical protein [Blautia luti]MTD60711.1 hypothetical protein [Blautia luti DSM 14534 = JCM 17040]BEI60355.1 oligosaccharide flippase family protein [Blautia luti]